MLSSLHVERAFTGTKSTTARGAVHKAIQNNMKRIWKERIKTRNTKKKEESYGKSKNELTNCLEI